MSMKFLEVEQTWQSWRRMPWTSGPSKSHVKKLRERPVLSSKLEKFKWQHFDGEKEHIVDIQNLTEDFPVYAEARKKVAEKKTWKLALSFR
jgi:hypothetical protein